MPQISKQTPPTKTIPIKTRVSKSDGGSVIDRISPIGFDSNDGIKVAFYGRSGTGKTTLWGDFPGKILAMICSGGDKPGELRSIDTEQNRKKIDQIGLKKSNEIFELVQYAAGKYSTVVLDHATGLQDLVLKEILNLNELPAQRTWGMASQQQYGQCTLQCKELMRSLLSMDCNVVIVAQEREFGSESESELITPTVGAGLTPSLTGWLNTAVDYICQTFIRQKEIVKDVKIDGKIHKRKERTDKVEFVLRIGPHAVYTTKFRMPKYKSVEMPDVIVDPDYSKIMKLIRAGE